MGQVLLVQAGEGADARPVCERAIALFRALCGLAPAAAMGDERFGIATFPRLNGSAVPLRTDERRFAASAGTWVCDGPDREPLANLTGAATDISRDALLRADGLFFAIAGDSRSITCVTDVGGRLHAYAVETAGCIVVSTSALVLAALADSGLDPLGCQEMLGAGSVFEGRSLFRGVTKLAPATAFSIAGGRIASQERYWSVRPLFVGGAEREPATAADLARALVGAVGRTLDPYVRPIVDLTGGFDSRAIVAAALATGKPFQCVVNGRDDDPDVVSAEGIARALGLTLIRLRPGIDFGARPLAAIERAVAFTDGEFDGIEYAGILEIHERLARMGDATVNGSAGEICRGYWWDLLGSRPGARGSLDRERAARRFAPDAWADGLLASPSAPSLATHFEQVIGRANAEVEDLPGTVQADNIYLTLRMQRWAGRLASATDRVWPCATPFMFRGPIEAALTAPASAKGRNRMAREILDHLNPDLAALPMAGGYPASPIRAGNVWRFGPLLAEWASKAAGRLRRLAGWRDEPGGDTPSVVADLWADDDVRAILRPAAMKTASLYRPEALAAFLERSAAPGFNDARRFGRILTLELVAHALARVRNA